jgi:hypothetical protein
MRLRHALEERTDVEEVLHDEEGAGLRFDGLVAAAEGHERLRRELRVVLEPAQYFLALTVSSSAPA